MPRRFRTVNATWSLKLEAQETTAGSLRDQGRNRKRCCRLSLVATPRVIVQRTAEECGRSAAVGAGRMPNSGRQNLPLIRRSTVLFFVHRMVDSIQGRRLYNP